MLSWLQMLNFATLDEGMIKNLAAEHDVHPEYVKTMAALDPSIHGKYTPWLLHEKPFNEHHEEAADMLRKFHNNQQKLPVEQRDITKHSWSSLHKITSGLDSPEKYPSKLPHGASLEHESGPYKFVKVTTPEASHKLCKDSGWCIGHKDESHAEDLLQDGDIHVVYKNGKRHAGVHLASNNFQDKQNKPHKDYEDIMSHWKQGKEYIASDPEFAVNHAKRIGKRTPELEDTIAESANDAMDYAEHLSKIGEGPRFEKGEAKIAESPRLSVYYAEHLGPGQRFPLGEKSIADSGSSSVQYAKHLGGRFEQGEPKIATGADSSVKYAEHLGGRFEQGEPAIAKYNYTQNLYEDHLASIGKPVAKRMYRP